MLVELWQIHPQKVEGYPTRYVGIGKAEVALFTITVALSEEEGRKAIDYIVNKLQPYKTDVTPNQVVGVNLSEEARSRNFEPTAPVAAAVGKSFGG